MFRKELKRRFELIFGVKKTTFDAPSESYEQDTLFISIENAKTSVGSNTQRAYVNGAITLFSQDDRLPYGFFKKRIEQADKSLTKQLFFETEIDDNQSPARLVNIHERRCNFVFLYDSQYDPSQGALTDLELNMEG